MRKSKGAKTEKIKENKKTHERAKTEDIEAIITDLGKQGNSPSKIGIILKEKYGIFNIKALGKKISKILDKNNISYQSDFAFVDKKVKKMQTHYEKNKQDKKAEREIVKYISLRKKLENNK